MKRFATVTAVVAILGMGVRADEKPPQAPEFVGVTAWVNTTPLKLAATASTTIRTMWLGRTGTRRTRSS